MTQKYVRLFKNNPKLNAKRENAINHKTKNAVLMKSVIETYPNNTYFLISRPRRQKYSQTKTISTPPLLQIPLSFPDLEYYSPLKFRMISTLPSPKTPRKKYQGIPWYQGMYNTLLKTTSSANSTHTPL